MALKVPRSYLPQRVAELIFAEEADHLLTALGVEGALQLVETSFDPLCITTELITPVQTPPFPRPVGESLQRTLQALAERNLLHSDLHGGNVLVSNGVPTLIDLQRCVAREGFAPFRSGVRLTERSATPLLMQLCGEEFTWPSLQEPEADEQDQEVARLIARNTTGVLTYPGQPSRSPGLTRVLEPLAAGRLWLDVTARRSRVLDGALAFDLVRSLLAHTPLRNRLHRAIRNRSFDTHLLAQNAPLMQLPQGEQANPLRAFLTSCIDTFGPLVVCIDNVQALSPADQALLAELEDVRVLWVLGRAG